MPSGLGRGLGSLIPLKENKTAVQGSEANAPGQLTAQIDLIKVNPHQPREDFEEKAMDQLADSIKNHGILQPLLVSKTKQGYQLIAGERRLRAAKKAGLKEVPIVLRQVDNNQDKLILAMIENLQREDLNAIEEAKGYRQVLDNYHISQEKLSKMVGRSRPALTNILRLLNLPRQIQQAIEDGRIDKSHGFVLVGIADKDKQQALFQKILDNKMSNNETVIEAQKMGGTKESRIKWSAGDLDLQAKFTKFFGVKTSFMKFDKNKSKLVLEFDDEGVLKEFVKKYNIE
ncbi:MAG: ParB/RepB/Spo0J family partition protein [bacterium]